jgi:hypothetical protein
MRQRTQDQQYDMQRMGAMGAMREMREPSIGEDDAMLEQEIRGGLYDPDTVRALRQDQRAMRQIMRDTNIDGTQRAQALGNLQSRMRMSRSTGKVQPMMQQMGPAALQTKPPMTEADYFSDEKNYANAYAAAQARLEAAGPDTPATPENIQAQMHNDYLARQKFVEGLRQPQGQGQPAAQPPNAPVANPQASYTGGQPTFGASPVMAQGGMQQPNAQGEIQQNSMRLVGEPGIPNLIAGLGGPSDYQPQSNAQGGMGAPVGQGAYQPTGDYTGGQPVFSTSPVLADPAKQQYAEVSGGNRDTQYSLQNPQMSAGQAYFDPNNPVRQEMSAADQSIVNPQKETLGKPGGRYGLGMIDYGINPATGNRVTASIRPGGTMPEYDEPVGPPGTAMGGRKGSLNIMGGKKKPAPAATAEVSPGASTPAQMAAYNALPEATAAPMRISRDDPRVKQAEMIAANPSATREQQAAAVATLDAAGFTEDDVAKLVAGRNSAAGSYRPSSGDMWGNPNKQPSAKKGSTWGTQKDILEIPERLYDDISAQVTATQRKVLGMPSLNDQEVADPSGELTETQRKNLRMQPKSKAEPEGGATAAPPAEKTASLELPEQRSLELADTMERTPQAVMFLDSMKKFADANGPEVSKAVMSIYEKKLSDKEKAEVIRGLIKMGVDIVAQDKKIRAEVLRKMPPNNTPKYPLPKNRGKFPTKDTNPRMFET